MKYIALVVLAVALAVSCSNPMMLPDEYYDARLEGTWVQDDMTPGVYKTITFNGLGGEFIGDINGTGVVEGHWTAGHGTLNIIFSEAEQYSYDYIFSADTLLLIPIGSSEGYPLGIEGGFYHR